MLNVKQLMNYITVSKIGNAGLKMRTSRKALQKSIFIKTLGQVKQNATINLTLFFSSDFDMLF